MSVTVLLGNGDCRADGYASKGEDANLFVEPVAGDEGEAYLLGRRLRG